MNKSIKIVRKNVLVMNDSTLIIGNLGTVHILYTYILRDNALLTITILTIFIAFCKYQKIGFFFNAGIFNINPTLAIVFNGHGPI